MLTVSVVSSDILFDFDVLGIMDGLDDGISTEEHITRAQFAQIVVNMMGYADMAVAIRDEDVFSDTVDNIHKGAINVLYRLNIISGTDQNTFSPNNLIRIDEACKILVNVLGYSVILQDETLESYYSIAARIGITKNVRTNDEFLTLGNTRIIINNALDIDIMIREYRDEEVYKIERGNTFRNLLLSQNNKDMVKMTGVVTADISTYLYRPTSSLRETQLEIEGKIFDYNGIAPLGFVGQTVEFYLKIEDENSFITGINPTQRNIIMVLHSDDIINVSNGRVNYMKDGLEHYFNIDDFTKYIYNNRVEQQFSQQQIDFLHNAVVRVIDNNNDGIANVLFIEEYIDCVVDRIYAEENMVYFKSSTQLNGVNYIKLDLNDDEKYVELRNSDGNSIEFDHIAEGDVLSIAISRLGDAVAVVVSDNAVVGMIDEFDDELVRIGSEEYRYNISKNELRIGKAVTAYLNFMRKVAYVEYISTENNYAYVYQIAKSKNIFSTSQVKLLIPGPVSVRYEEQEDIDGGDSIKTPKLFCRNSGILVYSLSKNISVYDEYGKVVSKSKIEDEILNKPITYSVNLDDEISRIEILSQAGSGTKKTYNANELTFGKAKGQAFGIQQRHTLSVVVPTNSDPSDDDLTYFVELVNDTEYDVKGFKFDENTYLVDLIVVKGELRADVAGSITTTSDVGIVTKVSQVIKEETNQTRIKITLLTNGSENDFLVSNLIPTENTFLTLKTGDLIAYKLDGFDNLNGFRVLQGIDFYYDDHENSFADYERFCGIVKNVKQNHVSNALNRWVYGVSGRYQDSDSIIADYEIFTRGNIPIFIIENNKNFRLGTLDDIQTGDRIFLSANAGRIVRAVVIYRD